MNIRHLFRIVALAAAATTITAACGFPGGFEVIPHDYTGGVQVSVRGIEYGPRAQHLADVYLSDAAGSHGDAGTIVHLHGGAWAFGDRSHVPSLLLHQVTRGWDLVSIDYRLSGVATFPGAVQDVAVALEWLATHGSSLGLNTDTVVLSGWSAGANIAALAAFGANADGFPAGSVPPVDGTLLLAGAYDLTSLEFPSLFRPGGWLHGVTDGRRLASPTTWLDAADPFTLAVHGADDTQIPAGQLESLRVASRSVGHTGRLSRIVVDDPALQQRCRGHEPWCGAPLVDVNAFMDSLSGR